MSIEIPGQNRQNERLESDTRRARELYSELHLAAFDDTSLPTTFQMERRDSFFAEQHQNVSIKALFSEAQQLLSNGELDEQTRQRLSVLVESYKQIDDELRDKGLLK